MKKLFFLSLILLSSCSVLSPLQKSKFISISNLIDGTKYAEAKEVIEEMILDEEFSKWPKTWYMKGLLCQTIYTEGSKAKDSKILELYEDPLLLAYKSYEKAIELDKGGKIEKLVAPKLILLANEFQKLGKAQFDETKYEASLNAFSYAMKITEIPFLAVEADTSLIYNFAIAAYENKDWENAIPALSRLHEYSYSPNTTHLLFQSSLEKGDTVAGQKVLMEGIKKYKDNDLMILLLTDLLYQQKEIDAAINKIEEVIKSQPENQKLHYTKGLVYQKAGRFSEAIEAYFDAIKISPDEARYYLHIATCYFNIGVDVEESTRSITNNKLVQEKKAESKASFKLAETWLDKAYAKNPKDSKTIQQLLELYKALRVSDKVRSIENKLD